MTDEERDRLLIEIRSDIKYIHAALERDYKHIHGNGQPGLLSRVQHLEDLHENENTFVKKFGQLAAWVVTTVIAVYSALKHH